MKATQSMDNAIEVYNLTKYYGDLLAVDHISFRVRQGEVFGFLGPNGAGKTTTQRMLTTLLEPTEGRILIFGHDLARNPYPVKRRMGLVPEESTVYTELTAWDNLMFTARLYRVPRSERAKRAQELLEAFGLWEKRNVTVENFSKGMRRRLSIAMAIIHRPALLFLDEPTSGLDAQSARAIRDLIRRLNAEGTTIFLTTHQIEAAECRGDDHLSDHPSDRGGQPTLRPGGDHQPRPHRRHRYPGTAQGRLPAGAVGGGGAGAGRTSPRPGAGGIAGGDRSDQDGRQVEAVYGGPLGPFAPRNTLRRGTWAAGGEPEHARSQPGGRVPGDHRAAGGHGAARDAGSSNPSSKDARFEGRSAVKGGWLQRIQDELTQAWAIVVKDVKVYYLRPGMIMFGFLMPFFMFFSFSVRREMEAAQAVARLLALTTFFTAAAAGPFIIPLERRLGTYDRLLAAPMSLLTLLLGKMAVGAFFAIMVSTFALLVGVTAFGATVAHPGLLLAGVLLGAFAFSALGLIFGSIPTRNPGDVQMRPAFHKRRLHSA